MSWAKRSCYKDRPELRAWLAYDWANSTFFTIVIATVFPVFYTAYASHGVEASTATFRFSLASTLAAALVAIAAPFLGAIADHTPLKKRFMLCFVTLGVVATAFMATISQGGWLWGLLLFVAANIGAMGANVFYDAFLPHIASVDEFDRVSTQGFALGYISGALILLLALLAIKSPGTFGFSSTTAVSKALFILVACWWGVFSIPCYRSLKEPLIEAPLRLGAACRSALQSVRNLFANLERYPQAYRFLIAFLIFNDGVGTVIKMAAIYGAEIGLDPPTLLSAILLVQCVGIPCTFAFGMLAKRIGAKASIYLALSIYGIVCVLGYVMTTPSHFYALALLIGMVQGGVQGLSRSVFASLIPTKEATQFFGLFAVFEKFAGIFGPLLFAAVIALTGQTKFAILGIALFFVVGALVLSTVDIVQGRADAVK